jgi:hypothetical protein
LALYHQEDLNKFNGFRVTRHCSSNATGNVAPLIICFLGLARYEMPHNSFIFWGVEGLYVGGYGVGGSKEVRYVLFMRKCPGS